MRPTYTHIYIIVCGAVVNTGAISHFESRDLKLNNERHRLKTPLVKVIISLLSLTTARIG
jgi:hypothetical protein